MRRLMLLSVFLMLALAFGCIEQTGYSSVKSEQISSVSQVDIDGDGSSDYLAYTFIPVHVDGAEKVLQRQITVAVTTKATYDSFGNYTDVDLLFADSLLESFSDEKNSAESECSRNLGIQSVNCIDVGTCVKLCEGNSVKCRRLTENYEEIIGGSMMEYIGGFGELDSGLFEARKDVLTLRDIDEHGKNIYLNYIRDVIASIAKVNSLPIYTRDEVQLCSHRDFGIDYLNEAASIIGNYSIENESYTYLVTVTVKDESGSGIASLGKNMEGIALQEKVPSGAIGTADELTSPQEIVTSNGGNIVIDWSPSNVAKDEYMLMYGFSSTVPPEQIISRYYSPKLTVKGINLMALEPVNIIFMQMLSATNNYYISLGFVMALVLIVLFIFFTIVTLIVAMLRAKASGERAMMGIRKSLGRTEIRWKTDLIASVVLLIIGFVAAMYFAPAAPKTESIIDLEVFKFMVVNWVGLAGVASIFIGVLLLYTTIENLVKIMLLERAYGVAIKEEKVLFDTRAKLLVQKLEELSNLVKEASSQEFEVGEEYDVVTSVRSDKVSSISKAMNARSKKIIDDDLADVERAIEKLKEKTKLAEENWSKWEEMMDKMLMEQEEVYNTSLSAIPTSMRGWAMTKYAKARKGQGISFEGNVLKRKKIAPEKILSTMMSKGLYSGVIVLKDDSIVLAEMTSGSATVSKVLAIKLKKYLISFGKNMGYGEPASYAAVGSKTVIVFMRDKNIESLLFIPKANFKEAVETWKANVKTIIG